MVWQRGWVRWRGMELYDVAKEPGWKVVAGGRGIAEGASCRVMGALKGPHGGKAAGGVIDCRIGVMCKRLRRDGALKKEDGAAERSLWQPVGTTNPLPPGPEL